MIMTMLAHIYCLLFAKHYDDKLLHVLDLIPIILRLILMVKMFLTPSTDKVTWPRLQW